MKKCWTCLLCLLMLGAAGSAAAETDLSGTWTLVELTTLGPNESTNTKPQPGLFVFTKKHYSVTFVASDKPRPDLPPTATTDAQVAASLSPFMANAGTYEVKGNTVTAHPVVALYPRVMAPGVSRAYEIKLEGDILWITAGPTQNGPPAFRPGVRYKLTRIE